jgi:hypothetical protein
VFVGVQVGTPAGPLCRPCSVPERLCGRARAVISTEKQSILLREFYRIGLNRGVRTSALPNAARFTGYLCVLPLLSHLHALLLCC